MTDAVPGRLSRNDRRLLLKEDEAWVGQPFDLNVHPRGIQANTRHMALMLLDSADKRRATRAVAFAEQFIDTAMNAVVSGPVACSKGCHFCCKTYVSATIPEVLRLAQALRGKDAKIARVFDAAERSKAIPQLEREANRVVCPILEDKICSEYLHRPLVCRAVLSKSLDVCLRIFEQQMLTEEMPLADGTQNIRAFMVIMFRAALILGGLPYKHVELNHALQIALRTENAEARWLAGEPLFDAVAVDVADQGESKMTGLVNHLVKLIQPTL